MKALVRQQFQMNAETSIRTERVKLRPNGSQGEGPPESSTVSVPMLLSGSSGLGELLVVLPTEEP